MKQTRVEEEDETKNRSCSNTEKTKTTSRSSQQQRAASWQKAWQKHPLDAASLISRLFFGWMFPFIWRGWRFGLKLEDMPKVVAQEEACHKIGKKLVANWAKELDACKWMMMGLEKSELRHNGNEETSSAAAASTNMRSTSSSSSVPYPPFFKYTRDGGDLGDTTNSDQLDDTKHCNGPTHSHRLAAGRCDGRKPSLARAVIKTHASWILFNSLLTFFSEVVCKSLSAYSVGQMLMHMNKRELVDSSQRAYTTQDPLVFWALCLVSAVVSWVLTAHFYGFQMMRVGLHVRLGCSYLIYRKSLKLGQYESTQTTMGKMTNLLSNDLDKFNYVCLMIPFLWVGPIQTIVSIYLLWPILGAACLGSVVILSLLTPIQFYLSRKFATFRRRIAACTDERVRLLTGTINALQLIKLYGWEYSFRASMADSRRKETDLINRVSIIKGISSALMYVSSKLVLFVTIIFHSLIFGGTLDAQTLFMSMAMLNNVQFTMTQLLPRAMSLGVESLVSLGRITDFLLAHEFVPSNKLNILTDHPVGTNIYQSPCTSSCAPHLNNKLIVPVDLGDQQSQAIIPQKITPSIRCHNIAARWPMAETKAIEKISFHVETPGLVIVCGQVASGKSSLFLSLLNELPISEGQAAISGSYNHSSQQAWLFNGTVRENILFGQAYNERRYMEVLEVCALKRDLELLEFGDFTYIQENSLSGGQKARVNLARCLYKDCDIYLLDDPFSALDNRVSSHIFEQAIKRFLAKKLVLLATHHLRFLKDSQKILLLDQGRQLCFCDYDSLITICASYSNNQRVDKISPKRSVNGADASEAEVEVIKDLSYLTRCLRFRIDENNAADDHHQFIDRSLNICSHNNIISLDRGRKINFKDLSAVGMGAYVNPIGVRAEEEEEHKEQEEKQQEEMPRRARNLENNGEFLSAQRSPKKPNQQQRSNSVGENTSTPPNGASIRSSESVQKSSPDLKQIEKEEEEKQQQQLSSGNGTLCETEQEQQQHINTNQACNNERMLIVEQQQQQENQLREPIVAPVKCRGSNAADHLRAKEENHTQKQLLSAVPSLPVNLRRVNDDNVELEKNKPDDEETFKIRQKPIGGGDGGGDVTAATTTSTSCSSYPYECSATSSLNRRHHHQEEATSGSTIHAPYGFLNLVSSSTAKDKTLITVPTVVVPFGSVEKSHESRSSYKAATTATAIATDTITTTTTTATGKASTDVDDQQEERGGTNEKEEGQQQRPSLSAATKEKDELNHEVAYASSKRQENQQHTFNSEFEYLYRTSKKQINKQNLHQESNGKGNAIPDSVVVAELKTKRHKWDEQDYIEPGENSSTAIHGNNTTSYSSISQNGPADEEASSRKLPGWRVWYKYYTQTSVIRLALIILTFLITQIVFSTIDIYLTVWSLSEHNKALVSEIRDSNLQQQLVVGGSQNEHQFDVLNKSTTNIIEYDSMVEDRRQPKEYLPAFLLSFFLSPTLSHSANNTVPEFDGLIKMTGEILKATISPLSMRSSQLLPTLETPSTSPLVTRMHNFFVQQPKMVDLFYTPNLTRNHYNYIYYQKQQQQQKHHSNHHHSTSPSNSDYRRPEYVQQKFQQNQITNLDGVSSSAYGKVATTLLTSIVDDEEEPHGAALVDRNVFEESEAALNVKSIYRPLYLFVNNFTSLHHALTYTILLMVLFSCSAITNVLSLTSSNKSAISLYKKLTDNALFAKMAFFDQNPIGRFLNRATRDIGIIDELIPYNANQAYDALLQTAATFIVVALVDVNLILPSLAVLLVFLIYHSIHVKPTMDIQRLEGLSRSPMLSHISTTLTGLHTIRATKSEHRFEDMFMKHQDAHTSIFLLYLGCNRTMAIVLDSLNACYTGIIAFWAVVSGLSGPSSGLIITSAMLLSGLTQHGMMKLTETESLMTSVERVIEYCNLPQEENYDRKGRGKKYLQLKGGGLAINSSTQNNSLKRVDSNTETISKIGGSIEYKHVDLYYRTKLDKPVLRNISFRIEPGEKVGIVGRTGAGKSSIITTLFRLYDFDGTILIDGVDIKQVDLLELRTSIAIIPQNPILFSTTIRQNLDPHNMYDDFSIWAALDKAHLRATVSALPGKLDYNIGDCGGEGGSFSCGQKQLICLTRVLLRQNSIIVMDEATANVDPTTDAIIQATIRREFKHCTVITIAHRLETILDCNRVMVLDAGRIVDFDTPERLAIKSNSYFVGMLRKASQE